MKDRQELAQELRSIARYFDRRATDSHGETSNIHRLRAVLARRAADTILSDGETIREYEEFVDGMEDDRK